MCDVKLDVMPSTAPEPSESVPISMNRLIRIIWKKICSNQGQKLVKKFGSSNQILNDFRSFFLKI
jgi:hypothetical protein